MTWYPLYAVRRFGWRDGLWRVLRFSIWPMLRGDPLRRTARRWRLRDRRPKRRGYPSTKYAIDRDGDLFLVECPRCYHGEVQNVYFDRERRIFACRGGSMDGHAFRVWLEDGVREIRDHRAGDIGHFPATVVWDEGARVWRLGLARDAPWWWRRRELYRDLQGGSSPAPGKDAHGHRYYEWLGVYQEVRGDAQTEQQAPPRPKRKRGEP